MELMQTGLESILVKPIPKNNPVPKKRVFVNVKAFGLCKNYSKGSRCIEENRLQFLGMLQHGTGTK